MAELVKPFVKRRAVNLCVTALVAMVLLLVYIMSKGTLRPQGFLSGWGLLAVVVFLALYNARKAVPFLPLGSSAAWLQFHIYCGFASFVMFAIHVRFSLPNGIFECCLAATYLLVFFSGVIGLYMTRTYPKRLTELGNEIIFEQIPIARRQLQDTIEVLVLGCNSEAATSAIPEFYRSRIRPFMSRQYDILPHLLRGSSWRFRSLKRAISDQRRYLDDTERSVMAEVEALITRKHQVDAQFALRGALKIWLFVHIPLTYALLIFAFFHTVLVHAWFGGLP